MLEGVAASLLLALVFLAGLTLRTAHRLLGLKVSWREITPSLGIGLLLACGTSLARQVLGGSAGVVGPLLVATAVSLLFAAILKVTRPPWLSFFFKLGLRRISTDSNMSSSRTGTELLLSSPAQSPEGV
jgi:hypothetical protein